MLGGMMMRGLRPAGDLRDGDFIPNWGQIRWLKITGDIIEFSPTNGDSPAVQRLPIDMEIWIERDEDAVTQWTVRPLPTVPVHR